MSLPSFSVRRPVTVVMIFAGIVLLGIISWNRLPQELFPSITYPQLTVVTDYPNAAPEEVETLITKPIEEAVGTVQNARRIVSTSREGTSLVIVEFNWDTDMNFAALGMREKIDLIKERLPREAEEPIVMKFNPFAKPVLTMNVSGPRPLHELNEIAKRYLKDRIEKVEGVASCSISGGIEREIHVEVSSSALHNSGIDLLQVAESLRESNLNYPAGTTKEEFFEWLIRTIGEFETVSEIDSTVVAVDNDEENAGAGRPKRESEIGTPRLISLSDIATVTDDFRERTSYSRFNGRENVAVAVHKQAEANAIRTVRRIRDELERVNEILPERVYVDIDYDQSRFIQNAIYGVTGAALQGGMLAVVVLFLFFRNIRSAFIVAFSIPISILAAFCLMYFSGLSVNIISFGGLALGIGMLVDNAIVVMENIFRVRGTVNNQRDAAEKGTEEVASAITASTFTTVAVFLPLVFVVGVAGQIFKDLALTITFSVLASLFVGVSLIPRLAMTGSMPVPKQGARDTAKPAGISFVYSRALQLFLAHKVVGLMLVFILFFASLGLFGYIEKEFMPKVDEGQFIAKLDMPPGTKLEATNAISRRIEEEIISMQAVRSVSAMVGSNKEESPSSVGIEMLKENQAQITVSLDKGRRFSTKDFVQELKGRLAGIVPPAGDIKFILSQNILQSAFQGEDSPIVIEVKGERLERVHEVARKLSSRIGRVRGVYDIKSSMENPAPETKIIVDKKKAALYNLSVLDIARTAKIALDGEIATKFKEEGREIGVRVRLQQEDRKDAAVIKQLRIISNNGIEIPLDEVTTFRRGSGPSEIRRIDKERTVLVYANVYGRNLNEVTSAIEKVIDSMTFPEGFKPPVLAGERKQMEESFASLRFALILSILVVYMIMAAQFESLWQPFIIMCSVPLAVIGIGAALYITQTSLNVVALLGVIVLGGIVVNNAIVLIDYINGLIRAGMAAEDAVTEAARTRLRPIIMTTLTTLLGLFPLALGIGEGGELISPLAITVMGGLLVSTFLTLLVIPAMYLIIARILFRRPSEARTSP